MSSLIRATNLWGYEELVRERGGDPQPFLDRYHLPNAERRGDDSFVPYRSAALLLEASAVELAFPDLGLRLAEWQGLEMLGPVAVVARNSVTLLDALEAIARYLHLHGPALQLRLTRSRQDGSTRFDFRITELSAPQLRQSYELSLANAVRMLRMLAGEDARPEHVSLLHRPMGPRDSYARAFGCEVRFEQEWCGWRLSAALGRQRVDHADAQTRHYAAAYLESRHAPGSAALSTRVVELIQRLLPTGQCKAEAIAAELAMHPRTLQRRLADDGIRYDELLDRERRQQAERYLGESGLHLVQITGLLGYTEQSTFTRSCQRWFGTTPAAYRAALRHGVIRRPSRNGLRRRG